MAVSKDVVKVKFAAKFGKVNLSKDFKKNLISKLADKIDDEDKIDDTLDLFEPLIMESAAEVDRTRTSLTKKVETKVDDKSTDIKEDELSDDTPPYIKTLLGQIKKQGEQISALSEGRQKDSLLDRFKKDERIKDIPEFVLKGYIPTKDDDFESNIEEVVEQYGKFVSENKITLVGSDAVDKSGKGDASAEAQNQKLVADAATNWASRKLAENGIQTEKK